MKRRLFDLVNVHLLAYVGISILLPWLVVSCSSGKATYTGADLALGREPKELAGSASNQPKDAPIFLVPVLGIAGALAAMAAFWRPDAKMWTPIVTVAAGALVLLLVFFLLRGFKLEREIRRAKAEAAEEKSKDPEAVLHQALLDDLRIRKTPFFYGALGAAALALLLSLLPGQSPVFEPRDRAE